MSEPALEFEFGVVTDPGRKRRAEPNQDSLLIVPADPGTNRTPLLIVADGMGGYKGGAVASQIVIETISKYFQGASPDQDIPTTLAESIRRAHEAIRARAAREADLASMGSTVVLALATAEKVFCANVGDSRAYLANAHQLRQISQDQSVVAEQVRAGLLTALQALRHPKRNRLTQSLNARRADIHPYLNQSEWGKEDVLLLCTDGLWGVVSEPILRAVAWELPPQQAAEKLVELSKASGAPDNVSVIIARRSGWQTAKPSVDDITNPGE
jgi:protein phosphatase